MGKYQNQQQASTSIEKTMFHWWYVLFDKGEACLFLFKYNLFRVIAWERNNANSFLPTVFCQQFYASSVQSEIDHSLAVGDNA